MTASSALPLPACPVPARLPACSDPSKLEALNLNPGVPRVDEQTRREFEQFKAREAASKRCAQPQCGGSAVVAAAVVAALWRPQLPQNGGTARAR